MQKAELYKSLSFYGIKEKKKKMLLYCYIGIEGTKFFFLYRKHEWVDIKRMYPEQHKVSVRNSQSSI